LAAQDRKKNSPEKFWVFIHQSFGMHIEIWETHSDRTRICALSTLA
jgi:hypothetical protein